MALQMDLQETNIGVPAPQAYVRIVAYSYDAQSNNVQVAVNIYASEAARRAGKTPIGGGIYSGVVGVSFPSLDEPISSGVRGALYSWLKTQPAFLAAVDVIDPIPEPAPEPVPEPAEPTPVTPEPEPVVEPVPPVEPPLTSPEPTPEPVVEPTPEPVVEPSGSVVP